MSEKPEKVQAIVDLLDQLLQGLDTRSPESIAKVERFLLQLRAGYEEGVGVK